MTDYSELIERSELHDPPVARALRELLELTDRQVKRTGKLTGRVDSLMRQVKERVAEIDALQAKIDSLMFEYCRDDMTTEQIANWEKHQKVSDLKLPPNSEDAG